MKYEINVKDPLKLDFEKFIKRLEKATRAKLVRDMDLLEEMGQKLGLPASKRIQKDIFELRTMGKQQVRVLYTIDKNQITILNWFIKKSRKLPLKELNLAIRRLTNI